MQVALPSYILYISQNGLVALAIVKVEVGAEGHGHEQQAAGNNGALDRLESRGHGICRPMEHEDRVGWVMDKWIDGWMDGRITAARCPLLAARAPTSTLPDRVQKT